MYIKAFKANEVNINVKLLLTKSESIAICTKGKNKVRKALLQHIAQKLMDIEDVSKVVGDNHIPFPKNDLNKIPEVLKNNESSDS